MNRIIKVFLVMTAFGFSYAQGESIYIMKQGAVIASYDVSAIDSIVFYNGSHVGDTMYIMHEGAVGWKHKVVDIDSMIFYDPSKESNTVTDYEGTVYRTVTIGSQTWMAENLKTTHYADGRAIPKIVGNNSWAALGPNDKGYCWFNDDSAANFETYGALYSWAAAVDGKTGSTANPSGIQGVCPAGWHLPSDDEWKELEMALGMSRAEADRVNGWRGVNEGSKLAGNARLWNNGKLDKNPEFGTSGFNALPAGYRLGKTFGICNDRNITIFFWAATTGTTECAYGRYLYRDEATINRRNDYNKDNGFCVRCVKD